MKYAICNELFGSMPFAETCALLREQGYQGIEIAPFTLFEDPRHLAKERIREIDRIIRDNGLEFAGFHWLFQTPSGLHITLPDAETRRRSWDHLKRLLEIAGELGGGVLALGSPKQRGAVGIPAEQAVDYLQEGLASVADFAVKQGCVILLESLSGDATNVVNTMAEADKMIRDIDNPGVQGIFDFHNCTDETETWTELIDRYFPIICHVHLNEWGGSYPGSGSSDFFPSFEILADKGYERWVSLEIFHEPEDPAWVLTETKRFLDSMPSCII